MIQVASTYCRWESICSESKGPDAELFGKNGPKCSPIRVDFFLFVATYNKHRLNFEKRRRVEPSDKRRREVKNKEALFLIGLLESSF